MAKRPSIVADLDLAPTQQPASDAPPTAEVVPIKAARKGRDVQHTSVYIPRDAYERLREIAFHERAKLHDLIMEGIDAVIRKRGHSERATSRKKA